MWLFIPLAGFLIGLIVARWWVVLAALPLGAYVLVGNDLEGGLDAWVALMLSTSLACAIACGVALRRLQLRGRSRANPSNG
jgi:uncharacterized membrane protein AbrB (regulator of aidB expression)